MKKTEAIETHYIAHFEKRLKTIRGTHFSILHEIFKDILSAPHEEQTIAFRAICETYGGIHPDESAELYISPYQEKIREIKNRKLEAIKTRLDIYVNKNYPRNQFYKKCFDFIFKSKSLKDESERVFTFHTIIMDRRIPYYPYNVDATYRMDEDRFRELLSITKSDRRRLQNYINRSFPQKTMQASAILDILGISQPIKDDLEAISKYEIMLIKMCFILFFTK